MRFTILGALLGSAALAGAGGIAITQTSATTPLRVVESPATTAPGNGAYVAKSEIVERDGVSYLDVAITYETAAKFRVKQRVCKRKRCGTVRVGLTVASGTGQASKRLGRGDFWLRGKPRIRMWLLPGPTVTVTAPPVTVTETVTETATATVTFTCRPAPPAETPTVPPTVTPTVTPTADPTDVPTDVPTDAPTDVPTDVPTGAPTDVPTNLPTDAPAEVPTCPQPTETPTETPTEVPPGNPTDIPTGVPTDTPPPTETVTPPTQ